MQFNNFPPGAAATGGGPPVYLTKVASGTSANDGYAYNFNITVPAATRPYRTLWMDSWLRKGTTVSVTLAGIAITTENHLNNSNWIYINGSWVNTSISGAASLYITTSFSERFAYVLWAAESDKPITFENETVWTNNTAPTFSLSKAYARGDAVAATAAKTTTAWTYSGGGGLANAFDFGVDAGNRMGGASLSEAGSPGTATWTTTTPVDSYASVTKFTN